MAFFDTHMYEKEVFEIANCESKHAITWFEPRLVEQTAQLARDHEVVCSFVEDKIDKFTISILKKFGIKMLALRSAGFNNVDVAAAKEAGMIVARVPEYSPYAVAEHAVALILCLNRKIHQAYHRVRDLNFSLEGLVGFDLHGKTVGVLGTGRIGKIFCQIMTGFGCHVIANDVAPLEELKKIGVRYASLNELFASSEIISLHTPLTRETLHIINKNAVECMRRGVMIINTGRGALIDCRALVDGLKTGKIGGAGLDVYEEEEGIFFHNLSGQVLLDDVLARLLTFPNVLITSHQAFLTREALTNIAKVTLYNIDCFAKATRSGNEL